MALWKRERGPRNLITSEDLAIWGKNQIVRPAGMGWAINFPHVKPLVDILYPLDGPGAMLALAELKRHAEVGPWEAVGACEFVREFTSNAPAFVDLVDLGIRALQGMRITNLGGAAISRWYREQYLRVTGENPSNDGFLGPPVFDSNFGPSKQFYWDQAVAAIAARTVTRLPDAPGVPAPVAKDVVDSCDGLALLLYRGAELVRDEIRFEPNVVRPAATAASNVDHALFADNLAGLLLGSLYANFGYQDSRGRRLPWPAIGAARFIEDYLSPRATESDGYKDLLDAGLRALVEAGTIGGDITIDVLSERQRERLAVLEPGWSGG